MLFAINYTELYNEFWVKSSPSRNSGILLLVIVTYNDTLPQPPERWHEVMKPVCYRTHLSYWLILTIRCLRLLKKLNSLKVNWSFITTFKQPNNGLHREPYQSIPHPVTLVFNVSFNIVLIFVLRSSSLPLSFIFMTAIMYVLAKSYVLAISFSHLNFNVSLSITVCVHNMKLMVPQFCAHSYHFVPLLQVMLLILYSGTFNNVSLLISAAILFV
jgi:hypothetical protein